MMENNFVNILDEEKKEFQDILPPKSQSNGLTHATPPMVDDNEPTVPASVENSPRRKLSNVGQTVSSK